jgi:hypothetical protein
MPRIGVGVGLDRVHFAGGFAGSYSSRVIADGGTIEALTCVAAASSLLQSASLLIIPSGYKAGVAYAVLPSNGNGDLTWSRNSVANRTQSDGNIGSVAANVPRLSYMFGTCPALLLEPQRTNLATWSEDFTNTSWAKFASSVTANNTTAPDGNTTADKFTANGTSNIHALAVNLSLTNATSYTFSAYAKKDTNDFLQIYLGTVLFGSNAWANFNLNTGVVGSVGSAATASIQNVGNGWYRIIITATTIATGNNQVAAFCLISSATSLRAESNSLSTSVFLFGGQLEQGAFSTTYISTGAATATRLVDTFSRNNIYTNALISASGGTWYVEMINNIAYTRDAAAQGIGIGDSSSTIANGFLIVNTGTGRQVIQKIIASATTNLFTTTTDTIKIAIKWNGTSADVFVNGTKQVSATAFTTTIMEFINGTGAGIPRWIKTMALYPTPLSDGQCQTLTT